ncbi:hypothetical protein BKH46_01275 [Helicobacter sp. 12S02634-8]|uniref:outer membrane beta-barrel protein n=1 Tax=Helicobacter sp. 12S02634-8 TaxID=1476199 RepID=UPI000BA57D66|nr:outer membrane beta-barrel protein [Helicobacter sp. 12S02634-8]PAF48563.1 hypothetical protein BKH46_01275 [Helicobacter sp. 12S02634-8]
MQATKKIFITTALSTLVGISSAWGYDSSARDKSGVFVGAGLGFSSSYYSHLQGVTTGKGSSELTSKTNTHMLYGIKAGYQQYFNAYNGLRAYGTFDYTSLTAPIADKNKNFNFLKYSVNIDYLLNFTDSPSPWGLFVGVGYQWVGSSYFDVLKGPAPMPDVRISTNGFVINAGFSKIIDNHHRLELGAKTPLYNYFKLDFSTPGITEKATTRNLVDVYFAYSYSL